MLNQVDFDGSAFNYFQMQLSQSVSNKVLQKYQNI